MASDYWRERAEADMDAVQDAAQERIRRIGRAHLQAARDLEAQVEKIIGRYAKRMGLSRAEAEKYLREPYDENSRAYGYRMTRAEALKQAAQEQARKLAELERREVKAQWEYTAQESARRAGAMLKNMGAGTGFASPHVGGLTRSINTRWAGKSYSENIWANTADLAEMLDKEVTAAFLSGKSNAAISQAIQERFGVGFRQAERLVRTETSYVHNQAALERYQKAGLERFEFLTARDSRTCPICAKRNGDIVPLEDGEPGKNMPPMHPWCRCTVLPVVREEEKVPENTVNAPSPVSIGGQSVHIQETTHVMNRGLYRGKVKIYETPDGTRFIFEVGMDKRKQSMTPEMAIKAWYEVPQEIRARAQKTVEFLDRYNPDDAIWRKKYKNFSRSYATGGQVITFYRHDGTHNPDYVVRTYIHEAGHFIDKNLGGGTWFSQKTSWAKAMVEDKAVSGKASITQYGENSPCEDFAESLVAYTASPAGFAKVMPNRHSILKSILQAGGGP